MRTAILLICLGGVLALSAWGLFNGWDKLDWDLGLHGWIALVLGVVLTIALGAGLMALSFYSSRQGYDDRVQPLPDDDSDEDR